MKNTTKNRNLLLSGTVAGILAVSILALASTSLSSPSFASMLPENGVMGIVEEMVGPEELEGEHEENEASDEHEDYEAVEQGEHSENEYTSEPTRILATESE